MAIQILTPPEDSVSALHEGLRTILHSAPGDAPIRALVERSVEMPQEGAPHPIYTISLDALARGEGLEAVKLIGWRYFLGEKSQVHASAETHFREGGHAFGGLNFGPFNGPMWERLAKLRLLPEVQTRDYEFRLLRLPAVYVMVFWLHSSGGGDDLISPLSPAPRELVDGQSYQPADFFAILRPLAVRHQEMSRAMQP